MTAFLGYINRLIDGSMRRNTVQIHDLIQAQPQQIAYPRRQLGDPLAYKILKHVIQCNQA
ncbi:hypothetical protein D3C84_1277390 [compost metagenome]